MRGNTFEHLAPPPQRSQQGHRNELSTIRERKDYSRATNASVTGLVQVLENPPLAVFAPAPLNQEFN